MGKWGSMLLTLLTTAAVSIGLYVGLRLEPLYQKMSALEQKQMEHEATSRNYVNDYIAFKAQTIEILRQQNETIREVREDTRRMRRGQ